MNNIKNALLQKVYKRAATLYSSAQSDARSIERNLYEMRSLNSDLKLIQDKANETTERIIKTAKVRVKTRTVADEAYRHPGAERRIMDLFGDRAYTMQTVYLTAGGSKVYGLVVKVNDGWLAIHAEMSNLEGTGWSQVEEVMDVLGHHDRFHAKTKKDVVAWLVEQSIRKFVAAKRNRLTN